MPVHAVVFPDIVTTFKRSLHQVISGYFDGNTHEINDLDIAFPEAKIVFDIHALEKPIGLTIAIIGTGVQSQEELKHKNPQSTTAYKNHGIELRAEIIRSVIIVVPDDPVSNRLLVDQAWSKLFAAVSVGGVSALAAKGILYPRLDAIPRDITLREHFAEVHGIFHCQVRAKYARYNT